PRGLRRARPRAVELPAALDGAPGLRGRGGPERQRGPPGLARRGRGVRRRQGTDLRGRAHRVRVQRRRPRHPEPGRGGRRGRGRPRPGPAPGPSGPPRGRGVAWVLVDRAFIAERRSAAAELAALDDLAHLGPQGAGAHIVLDALAAAALARAHGVEPRAIRDGLRAYRMGAHRAQHLATVDGIDYVDDTKA